jgi:Uma2 family endonuclease
LRESVKPPFNPNQEPAPEGGNYEAESMDNVIEPMSTLPKTHITVEEYLAFDDASPVKNEYYAGQMYAMSGALRPHNVIAVNATIQLGQQLRGQPCELYSSDQRVRTIDELFAYPDLSVACQPVFLEESEKTLVNPVLIVEVLSPSTEGYDRGGKFEAYQTIASLKEYLLIASNHMRADLFSLQADGRWILSSASKPEQTIELSSCGCTLKMADLYEKLEFTAVTLIRPV